MICLIIKAYSWSKIPNVDLSMSKALRWLGLFVLPPVHHSQALPSNSAIFSSHILSTSSNPLLTAQSISIMAFTSPLTVTTITLVSLGHYHLISILILFRSVPISGASSFSSHITATQNNITGVSYWEQQFHSNSLHHKQYGLEKPLHHVPTAFLHC